ncbi:histidine phosphatase family protein [Pseudomonas sp. McL0111]|uniref:lipopolysaccharide core heptose(II)-phosphate phosphatase PmrG n=1 Tax=Pseudomonas sp. McL0111 TaxID=3457357 RepID=UPI00403EA955
MLVFVACLTLVTALVSGFLIITRSPTDLGHAGHSDTAQWMSAWKAGEIVALVRHEERCDRSTNACLGPADGITKLGSDSAASIGRGFVNLGMQQAQVFSSPLTRTMQTAQYMFGEEAVAQDWLEICGPTFRNDIAAHKTAQRNLVLVTHSGCISDFEKQTGYPHAIPAAYGSALLMRIDAKGDLKVLGILNPDAWAQFKKQ